ncbi:MAG: tyrosine--tRNA ligase, partial [Parachlamydiaceae bacterium]
KKRGCVDALSHESLNDLKEPLTVYCGFDPTADSLHLGNFVAIMGLARFKKAGHKVIAIVGGATGMIGDPSGKSTERNLLDEETIEKNRVGISKCLKDILGDDVPIVNNYEWYKDFNFITFLREVGKQFRMGIMLSKESVKARLNSEEGLSFTEFCYQILQAYDFLWLNQKYGVNAQIGGADQWGNITAGIELIRKEKGKEAYGITFPLLTKSDGQKFGKSEKGAIWLSADKLSPYEFYQHLIRTDDRDVIKLLKMITFVELEEIEAIEKRMANEPGVAQKRLAEAVTEMVHGKEGLEAAKKTTELAQPGHKVELSLDTFKLLEQEIKPIEIKREEI